MELPFLGFGLGLRPQHYDAILNENPPLDWFEILTENYLVPGGKSSHYLERIREKYPVAMHGVSLSLGGSEALDSNYLQQVKALIQRVEPVWVSDHLCWTGINGIKLHDLLPLPYTEEAVQQVVSHIQQVQDFLGRRILIENVSSYLTYLQSEMTEWEFLTEIVERADCLILLDVNNVYVSACNQGFSALKYLRGIPKHRVCQIHLAGHTDFGDYLLDTHDALVSEAVWDLYGEAVKLFGAISTMIERDDNIPALKELVAEVERARQVSQTLLAV